MKPVLVWILGRGGFLGGWLERLLPSAIEGAHAWPDVPPSIPWHSPDRLRPALEEATRGFAEEVRRCSASWQVHWCAGAGAIGTPPALLDVETAALRILLESLARRGETLGAGGRLLLASSAGAAYGEPAELPLTEDSPCRPISAYGRNKLLQERLALDWTERTGLASTLVARIANLYGPSRSLHRPAGLIGRVARSLILHEPVHVYVPLDTLRDYLHGEDAASSILRVLHPDAPAVTRIRIFASGHSTSVGNLLGTFTRIAKRRPRVVLARHPLHLEQPLRLRFRPRQGAEVPARLLPEGIHSVLRSQIRQYQGRRDGPPAP